LCSVPVWATIVCMRNIHWSNKKFLLLRGLGSNASLSASYIVSLIPTLKSWGVDTDALIEEIGLAPEQINTPGYRLSIYHALRLFYLCQKTIDDPLLGIHLGRNVRPKSFPVLGYAAMSSSNLGEAISRLLHFEKLVWNMGSTQLKHGGDTVKLKWSASAIAPVPTQFVEGASSGWIHFGKQVVADSRNISLKVFFKHAPLVDTKQYQELLGYEVLFNQQWNGIELATSALDQQLIDADPELRQLMDKQGARLLKNYRERTNLVNEVRALLVQYLEFKEPSIEEISEQLNMSSRGLVSRLGDQGVTFTSLVDEVRKELAISYLSEKSLALVDIAFLLGFSEQSAFTRAFKRWTSQTPGQYRRCH
jgi:AraC-like DNA-binding protein